MPDGAAMEALVLMRQELSSRDQLSLAAVDAHESSFRDKVAMFEQHLAGQVSVHQAETQSKCHAGWANRLFR